MFLAVFDCYLLKFSSFLPRCSFSTIPIVKILPLILYFYKMAVSKLRTHQGSSIKKISLGLALICGCTVTSKLEAVKSSYYIKVAQIKNSLRICYTNLKSFSTKFGRIFLFEHLLFNKVDFGASDFEAAVQLQIEAKQKILG